MRSYRCYCGSECGEAQCRFYTNRAEYEKQQAEFWAQWAEAQRRLDAGEQGVSV